MRGLRQKWDALRVQNGQSLSKYQGLIRKLVCYKGISFFWTYLNSILFLCSKCTIQRNIINFQPFLASFGIFHEFTDFLAKWPWNWKALQISSEKVESWHSIIISPTYHVLKCWEGYDKNWMHFVYKTDNLFGSISVSNENSSITKGFHFFELIWTADFVCVLSAPFKATSSIVNPFPTSFAIFHAFYDFFWAKWPWN